MKTCKLTEIQGSAKDYHSHGFFKKLFSSLFCFVPTGVRDPKLQNPSISYFLANTDQSAKI